MRRAGIFLFCAVAIGVIAFSLSNGGQSMTRVDAIFDTADGMVAGQNVEIAGAKVGTVRAVKLLGTGGGGYRALLELSVPSRFAPFRADASCRILPEGIISENYVDCDPGTNATPLRRGSFGAPTIPVTHTSAPLSLQAVLDTFAAPAPERLQILMNELGIATAGRGADLNSILERADPALRQANGVLSIIDRQRNRVAHEVTQTDQILGALGARSDAVRAFVDRSATVLSTTAGHAPAISASLKRLPAMLTALDNALAPIKRAAGAGIPLLQALRAAAPGLNLLTQTLPAFTRPAVPAVRAFGAAAATGLNAVRAAMPVGRDLRTLALQAAPVADLLDRLLLSFRDSGGVESLLNFTYALAITWSAYNSKGHEVVALPLIYPACVLENMVPYTKDSPGCSHAYSAPGLGQIPPSQVPSADSAGNSDAKLASFLNYLLK